MSLTEFGWVSGALGKRASAKDFYVGQVVVWKAQDAKAIIGKVDERANRIEVIFECEYGVYTQSFNCADLSTVDICIGGKHG